MARYSKWKTRIMLRCLWSKWLIESHSKYSLLLKVEVPKASCVLTTFYWMLLHIADSVRAFKERMKLGRFNPEEQKRKEEEKQKREEEEKQILANMEVGNR